MAISRNRRDNKSGRGSPEPTWLDAVAVEAITKNQIVYVDSLPVTGASFSTTSIGQDVVRKVGVATNATRKKAVNSLYIALTSAAAVGDKLKIAPIGLLNNLDTSGGAAGDPVYLSTAGLPTLAATAGFTRRIGEVVGVGVSGTGTWNFAPGQTVPAAKTPLLGTAAASGASVTVTDPFGIGASITGSQAFAMCATVSGVITATACTWSGNNLVITFSASFTGNVNYQIWV